MRVKVKNFLLFVLVLVCFYPLTGRAITWYVSQSSGDDQYNGLEPIDINAPAGPFKTIAKAASVIQPGDSVLIRSGNYPEQVMITNSGNDVQPIVITNYPEEKPVLTAADWNGSYAVNLNGVSYIHLIGLEFRDSPEDRKALLLDNSHYCLVSRCVFKNNAGSATVHLKNSSFFNEISDCEFQDNGNGEQVWDSHIYLQDCGELNRIKSNNFTQSQPGNNLTDRGVWCAGTSNTLITQNTFQYLEKIALYVGIENDQYDAGDIAPGYNIVTGNDFVQNSGSACFLINTHSTTVSGCLFSENHGDYTLTIRGKGAADNLVDGNTFRENWSLLADHSEQLSVYQAGAGNSISNNIIYGTPGNSVFQIVKSYSAINIISTNDITIEGNEIYDLCYPATVDKSDYNTAWVKTPQQGGKAGHGIYVDGADAFIHNVKIINNKISNLGASAISLLNCEECLVAGNTCSGNGAWGISVLGRRNVIENNKSFANGWMHGGCSGINIHGMGPDNIVRQNLCYNNRQGTAGETGWDWWSDGNGIIADQGADSTWIYNNICFGNDGPGIALTASSGCYVLNNTIIGNGYCEYAGYKAGLAVVTTLAGVREARNETIINNIFTGNAWYQLSIADVADHSHVLHHNLYYSGPDAKTGAIIYYRDLDIPDEQRVFYNIADFRAYWQNRGNELFASGSMDVDPQLLCGLALPDSAAGVALMTGSPARRAGVSLLNWFNNDFYNAARPLNNTWDFGAIQYIGHAPEAFVLLAPVDKEKVKDRSPVLRWQAAYDRDPGDSLYYRVKVSAAVDFVETIFQDTTPDTEWTVPGGLKDDANYFWQVSACDLDGHETSSAISSFVTPLDVGVSGEKNATEIPVRFRLYPNYPNPFNPATTFQVDCPKKAYIELKIFSVTGQLTDIIYSGMVNAGTWHFTWQPGGLPTGLYLARLESGTCRQTLRLLYVK